MAKLHDSLFGSGKGSIGKVVVYSMHGKTYIRSRPSHYKDAKTRSQLAQREVMNVVTEYMSPFKELFRITYAGVAVGKAPYHAAKSYLMNHALEGEYPDQRINLKKALISKGPVMLPSEIQITRQQEGLLFTWDTTTDNKYAKTRDTLIVISRAKKNHIVDYQCTGVYRRDGKFLWQSGFQNPSDKFDIWVAFRNYGETELSDSLYLGEV